MSLATAKFTQKIRITASGVSVIDYDFEVDSLTFGFPEIAETYEFWDFSREKVSLGFRFFCAFNSRFLRRADASSDIRSVLNTSDPLTFLIDGIGMTEEPVIIEPVQNQISVQRQRIIRNYDFVVTGVNKVDTIPSWFTVTANKPGYL